MLSERRYCTVNTGCGLKCNPAARPDIHVLYLQFDYKKFCFVSGWAATSPLLHSILSAGADKRTLFCFCIHKQTQTQSSWWVQGEQVIFKNQKKVADGWFADGMCLRWNCLHVKLLPHQTSDAAELSMDAWGCRLMSVVCLCVFETEEWERLEECTKSVLSGCVATKLKMFLNNHSQHALHCTLFKSRTPWSSKCPQPPHQMAKWPYVTTLFVPLPFFFCHLASNEHRNGSRQPSRRAQICVPVCFKHLLRPHLAESALGWAAMWFLRPRAARCRQMQSERVLERQGRYRERWRWTERKTKK